MEVTECWSVQPHTIDQAVLLRAVSALVEFLRIRKVAYKRRSSGWATVCFLPKFHCELNFIEPSKMGCKRKLWEVCDFEAIQDNGA